MLRFSPKDRTGHRGRFHIGDTRRLDASGDMDFRPDTALKDGDTVSGDGWTMEAVTTPGHTANHMAFAYKEGDLLFAGDHVMAWSTTIVAPPDGAMSDYMASLEKLARRPEPTYLPGHGAPVRDAQRYVQFLIHHRQGREASILHRLGKGEADVPTIVKAVYIGLDPRLVGAASTVDVLADVETGRTRRSRDRRAAVDQRHLPLDRASRCGAGLSRFRGGAFLRVYLPSRPFQTSRFFRRLRHRRRQDIVNVVHQCAHARGIAAEIVRP